MYKIILILTMNVCVLFNSKTECSEKEKYIKIKISMNNEIAIATIYDNPTAKDFLSLLPLTLELKDYASTEKVSDLSKKLSLKDAPSGSTPSTGDIAYYSPWGNLAFYYKDFSYSEGLIKIGKIESGMEIFNSKSPLTAKIEILN